MAAGMGCGFKCAKFLLFAFNLLFWMAGAVLLAIGIWFLADTTSIKILNYNINTSDSLVRAAAIALVVVGGLMFIVGGLGCYGACAESSTCLIIFATILFILLAGQVAAGILAGVFRQRVMNEVQATMNTTVQVNYGRPNDPDTTTAWDFVQNELTCCGVIGPSDWLSSNWYINVGQNQSRIYPDSCCTNATTSKAPVSNTHCPTYGYLNAQGCYKSFSDWVTLRLAIIIGIAIGLCLIQLIGIIMACCMGQTIRNKNVYK